MHKLILILVLLTVSNVFAATSGQIGLRAKVPKIVSIEIIPLPIASNLPLNQSQVRLKVAETLEKWNSKFGTKIQVRSANRGYLVHGTIPTSRVPYEFYFAGRKVNLTNTTSFFRLASGVAQISNPIEVTYTGLPFSSLIEGDYSDVITFTISAN